MAKKYILRKNSQIRDHFTCNRRSAWQLNFIAPCVADFGLLGWKGSRCQQQLEENKSRELCLLYASSYRLATNNNRHFDDTLDLYTRLNLTIYPVKQIV